VLARIPPADQRFRGSFDDLIGRLRSGDEDAARAAWYRFGRRLGHDDPIARIHAGFALADMGPEAQPAVPALQELLNGEDVQDRRLAAWTLGKIGPRAVAALPALHHALHDLIPWWPGSPVPLWRRSPPHPGRKPHEALSPNKGSRGDQPAAAFLWAGCPRKPRTGQRKRDPQLAKSRCAAVFDGFGQLVPAWHHRTLNIWISKASPAYVGRPRAPQTGSSPVGAL
jgi:hypothetical protein